MKNASAKLTGFKRREFIAELAFELCSSSARKGETIFGCSRITFTKGLGELRNGIKCCDNFSARGRKKCVEIFPSLRADIVDLIKDKNQTDPTFKTTFKYLRITAKRVREHLIKDKGYCDAKLPSRQTIGNILNRAGYRLRKTLKSKPLKKIKETDDIFANLHSINSQSDNNPASLRISIDCKAKVRIGNLSRGGKSRGEKAKTAYDHDTSFKESLVPFGILDVNGNHSNMFLGTSYETADFIADCLNIWYSENIEQYQHIKELIINLDNGPSIRSNCAIFMKRMIQFAETTQWDIRLSYYPPYHSKYNSIEHFWGVLENFWNGTILDSRETTINWLKNMKWNGLSPRVHLIENEYQKGIKVNKKERSKINASVIRSIELPKWDVSIIPDSMVH